MSFILHHYPNSPFAEKVRLLLGYAGVSWQSCLTTEAPPRTELMMLTGGYNRIPIAQIGADVFCDSNLIAKEIASISGIKALSPLALSAQEKAQQDFFESKLFFACVNKGFSLGLLARIAKDRGLIKTFGMIKDRVGMKNNATISMGSPKSAPFIIQKAVDDLTPILSSQAFLGGDEPSLLDFALYHDVWFVKVVGKQALADNDGIVVKWFERMTEYSKTSDRELSIQEALSITVQSEPRPLSEEMKSADLVGERVAISTTDYRRFPIEGTLAGANEYSWVLRREVSVGNVVHVHFPKEGYELGF